MTALVTPFNRDGSLDLAALDAVVDAQLAAGINGLVPCGTTGETATLSLAEQDQVIGRVVKRVNKRVPVLAGTGSNCTATTQDNQRRAQGLGVDYGLVVTPYYNKPTPEGLFRHYSAVAEASSLPVLVYNVPGRTGGDLKPDTMHRLRGVANIVGIKEATGELDRVAPLRQSNPQWSLLSGDDASTCAFVLMGGDGVISVVSNAAPADMVALVEAARAGKLAEAREHQARLRGLMAALFVESNPLPVKTAMALQGHLQEVFRLPLCEMQPANRQALCDTLRAGGWL